MAFEISENKGSSKISVDVDVDFIFTLHYLVWFKVTANLFGLEFCKILKSYHKIARYIYFVLKKKLFENVFFFRCYCKFCVLRD